MKLAQRITQGSPKTGERFKHQLTISGFIPVWCGNVAPVAYVENADDAELIREAFSVTHETGLTPGELATYNERLSYAINQIGFYFAGSDNNHVADICLRVLAGESLQDIRRGLSKPTS